MIKRYLIALILILFSTSGFTHELEKKYQNIVQAFIDAIENNDLEKLNTLISYPFGRQSPLPDVKNKAEFIDRYNEIFDKNLTNIIVQSDLNTDWSPVGWRGIMLNNGAIWLDYDGRLLAVNYQSEAERIKRNKLIEVDRNLLHKSLQQFQSPILVMETETFRVRIDALDKGFLRYASWSVNAQMNEKPDLVLVNGIRTSSGSGGNHKYEFTNGNYKYECWVNILRNDETPSANLVVYENDKEILSQSAKIIK